MMDKELREEKKRYEEIPIPKELKGLVEQSLASRKRWVRKNLGMTAAVIALLFVGTVNTNVAFAQFVYEIPLLGDAAKIVTFKQWSEQDDSYQIQAKVPGVNGEEKYSHELNRLIEQQVNEAIAYHRVQAEEYKEAYLATGGDIESYRPVEIQIDYEVMLDDEQYGSFILTQSNNIGNGQYQQHIYNIDLSSGEVVTLNDLLGAEYQDKVDDLILAEMEKRQTSGEVDYFDGEVGFQGIEESQSFYLNAQKNPVIVFDKYAIAPGAYGMQSFEIKLDEWR